MTRVAAELREFVARLARREDITVKYAELGPPASAAALDQLRAARVPQELIELYAEIDGIHIEWRFIEPKGCGCMKVPALSDGSEFLGDEDHYMNFGEDREALLLDRIFDEASTWLVRARQANAGTGPRDAEILFASHGDGEDAVVAATSVAAWQRVDTPRCQGALRAPAAA